MSDRLVRDETVDADQLLGNIAAGQDDERRVEKELIGTGTQGGGLPNAVLAKEERNEVGEASLPTARRTDKDKPTLRFGVWKLEHVSHPVE